MKKDLIRFINNNTETLMKDVGVTKKLEFIDKNGVTISDGIPYHIHITTDKKYWYMTGKEHESNSILIFRVDGKIPDYITYRKLAGSNRQEYLNESRTTPLQSNYDDGFIILYFARQANDKGAKVFEISRRDYGKRTPFYSKTSLILEITGDRDVVEKENQVNIFRRNSVIPGLSDVVAPLQFYKPNKNTKESVQDRLKNYQQQTPSSTSGGSSGGSSGGGY
jgi:hypothetical protein